MINQRKIDCPKPVYGLEINVNNFSIASSDLFVGLNGTQKSELINYGIEKFLQLIIVDLNPFIFNFLEINVSLITNYKKMRKFS
jgi:hypothetical protein